MISSRSMSQVYNSSIITIDREKFVRVGLKMVRTVKMEVLSRFLHS